MTYRFKNKLSLLITGLLLLTFVGLTNLYAGQSGTPTGLSAATDLQVKLSWTSNGGDSGSDGEWEIKYTTSTNATAISAELTLSSTSVVYTTSTVYTKIITNLIPRQTYYFWIRAKDGVRDGDGFSSFTSSVSAVASSYIFATEAKLEDGGGSILRNLGRC